MCIKNFQSLRRIACNNTLLRPLLAARRDPPAYEKDHRMMSVRFPLRLTLLVCGFLGLAALPATAQQPALDKIVAKVDGAPITEADVTQALTDLGESIAQIPEAQRRDYAITYLPKRPAKRNWRKPRISSGSSPIRRIGCFLMII
jgi:hypothetical protein